MKFHHIGIATKDIAKTQQWVQNNFNVKKISEKVYDTNQDAHLQMIETDDMNIELVSGKVVEKFVKSKVTYYHICYEVKDIDQAIKEFSGAIVISSPKEAILFNNRKVAFLITPIGLVELLENEEM